MTSRTETATFEVVGMHCPSCGVLIDETLEDCPGVQTSRTHVRRRCTTVTFDPATTRPEDIVEAIAAAGYQAALQPPGTAEVSTPPEDATPTSKRRVFGRRRP